MDISKLMGKLFAWLRQHPIEPDDMLDVTILEALLEETNVPIPEGAWDRLRRAIVEYHPISNRGMWILDEPFRDPPEAPPTLLSQRQFERAHRIYSESGHGNSSRIVWESLKLTFSLIVSL